MELTNIIIVKAGIIKKIAIPILLANCLLFMTGCSGKSTNSNNSTAGINNETTVIADKSEGTVDAAGTIANTDVVVNSAVIGAVAGTALEEKTNLPEELTNLKGKTIEELMDIIKNGEELKRKSAEAALIDLGPSAIKPSVDAYVQASKIDELNTIQDEKEVKKQLDKFGLPKNDMVVIRGSLVYVLSKLGEPAVKPLLQAVENTETSDLEYGIQDILVNIGTPAVDSLITALKGKQDNVPNCAIMALGNIGDPKAIEPLISVIEGDIGDSGRNYDTALNALVQLGEPAVEPLISLMQSKKRYANSSVQADIAEKLGYIGDNRAIEPLIEELSSKNSTMRVAAARGLGELKDSRVDSIMTDALTNKKLEIIAGACQYFIRQGEPAAEELLIKAFKKYSDSDTAEYFLNSGNEKLEAAASKWAEDNGFMVTSFPGIGGGGTEWGSGN